MQIAATKITQHSRTQPRSPTPMHKNAQQQIHHALKNPRLLQIQHSPRREFIDRNSQFCLLFLLLLPLLGHRQPPSPPSSPAGAAPPRSQLKITRHRTDRKPANYEIACVL
ncbi:hypothetical protein GmHk_09G025030 [Glycine max]|nr:hypothetical protein GmHk_09G025030 [Glycine max]